MTHVFEEICLDTPESLLYEAFGKKKIEGKNYLCKRTRSMHGKVGSYISYDQNLGFKSMLSGTIQIDVYCLY